MLVILATQEAEIKELRFKDTPSKKLVKPYLKNKKGMVAPVWDYACNPSYTGARGRTIKA
jgi:hypothetical protein